MDNKKRLNSTGSDKVSYLNEVLSKSEEIYKLVIENTSDYVALIDEMGAYIYVSPSFHALGYRQEDLIGRSGFDFVHPDDRARLVSILATYVAKLAKSKLEDVLGIKKDISRMHIYFRFRDKKGEWHDIETTLDIVKNPCAHGYAGLLISKDISRRRKEEEALRKSDEKFLRLSQEFNALLDAIPDNLTLQSRDLKIQWANEGAARCLGKKISDITGGYCYELWHSRSSPCESCPVQECFVTGKPSHGKATAPDGKLWELRAVPIIDENGDVTNAVEVGRNITDIKKAEELRIENTRLAIADRAKAEFLAVMSHELRTPLNSILGFSELMKNKIPGELNEKQEHYIDLVISSGMHLLDLVNNILEITSAQAGKMELIIEKVSISGTIDAVMSDIREKAEKKNIAIEKKLDHDIEFIEADAHRLAQILYNLLNNAIKFSKPEGGIVIISVQKEGDMAKFSVSDTGIGIKPEDMGRLFTAFEQMDSGMSRRYGGAGVGLATTRKLVELHGGRIWAESRHGEGSTFTFLLPVAARKPGN